MKPRGMDYIEKASRKYGGALSLHPPYEGPEDGRVPEELYSVLRVSDGVSETMNAPGGGETEIAWIIYTHEMILRWSSFYNENYGVCGAVFSDDGADCVYILKYDGTVACFDCAYNEEFKTAESLSDFFL
ncbi:hypothetical protein B5F39_07615 [Cloacibacillus sp. An23]|nr:hypothetical protein B5F39_07615 [Cloacibacillus sp. An23]